MVLPRSFYEGEDILEISKSLLGKKLCSDIGGQFTSGIIVETEAYKAPEDKASHAFGNKVTPRTVTMFSPPGTGYIYIIYGMYHLFNVITGPEGTAHCILIRAVEPLDGQDVMLERRGKPSMIKAVTNGPGKFSIAMGMHKKYDATDLTISSDIWIETGWPELSEEEILVGPRVGMSTAEECSNWPYRFRVKGNKWTSKPDKVWYDL
ncbi:DNA-3-methyladenine glycosylase [Portibacter lacus]|uniref:Putative 3-methyladenine DNA glycosylase n=1 Tax=Portibacter lacus TaxID=1099794 RepID=A0AA37WF98_9BACT|nr:DNA-3-methyladenine glycosylase [Portibacter lacus]GLR16785.1 putative 3-methyladenine DNA glycosylase [Portibacter lacus]